MLASVGGKGDCYDNSMAEGSFASSEFELFRQSDRHPRAEAWRVVFCYIEKWHNRKRHHSTQGYDTPAPYEAGRLDSA
jgi:putative transposase